MGWVLGSGSLTKRLRSAHSSSQSSFTSKKSPRDSSFRCLTECFQSTEQKTRATGFSCIVINKAGVNTFCTRQPSPVHPLPPTEHHTFLLHKSWGPSVPPPYRPGEHRWRKKAKYVLSFPWHNLGIALGATALAEHHQGRTTLWSARVASLYLANHALQYMAASQASRSKAAECQEILRDEREPRR